MMKFIFALFFIHLLTPNILASSVKKDSCAEKSLGAAIALASLPIPSLGHLYSRDYKNAAIMAPWKPIGFLLFFMVDIPNGKEADRKSANTDKTEFFFTPGTYLLSIAFITEIFSSMKSLGRYNNKVEKKCSEPPPPTKEEKSFYSKLIIKSNFNSHKMNLAVTYRF